MEYRRMRIPSFTENMKNITFQQHKVSRADRAAILGRYAGYRGCTIWFTGLSGAGKTTISFALEKILTQLGVPCYGLDGDNVRHGLCKDLGFSRELDRVENIRRVAEVAKLFADMGIVTLASFISPFSADREKARLIHEQEGIKFIEVYISTPLDVCEARDPKNLYKRARSGELTGFTGIDSSYEPPETPDLMLNTEENDEANCVMTVLKFLFQKGILPEKAIHAIHALQSPAVRELFVTDEAKKQALMNQIDKMPRIELSLVDLQWLQVLAEGWATPLSGYMRERQYLQALHHGQIFDLKKHFTDSGSAGPDEDEELFEPINQSIPIVLAINDAQKELLYDETTKNLSFQVGLFYDGVPIAVLSEPEVYAHRKLERVNRQFGCSDLRHPTIRLIMDGGDWLLGGNLKVFERIRYNDGLDQYRKTPMELRAQFRAIGCDGVFAFQLRNPIHNGHALLMREAREKLLRTYRNPILLLHPLGGWTKNDDVPLPVRMAQHNAVIQAGVLDAAWTMLAIFPSPMLYGGPTEVQWHARARMACGVNAYIVGRDPAGIQNPENGDYLYEPTHGAKAIYVFYRPYTYIPKERNLLSVETIKAILATKTNFDFSCTEMFDYLMKNGSLRHRIRSSGKY